MRGSREKESVLQENGYHYNFHRKIYFNLREKKIFSTEWVEDNDLIKLLNKIKEEEQPTWQFFFSGMEPSELLKKEVIKELKHKN